ncbi:MAG: glycerol kinase GlpK, partial [Thermoleophilia bacterium]|nr:glycerol kinase GlpK [Thermoleophilia bacterium]
MPELILSVDQGTTGTTCLVVEPDGTVRGRGCREHPQLFPAPGLVEHDPEAIWRTVLVATSEALAAASATPNDLAGIGITNQRETVVCWDATTGRAVGPTIVWQDRRTAERCSELRDAGHAPRIRAITGLPIDPYFSATKIEWLLHNDDGVRALAAAGTLRIGTIDSWLVHRMTGGASHITDASNAARTLLYDIHAGAWSDELCSLFGVDPAWLPTVVASSGEVAHANSDSFSGISAPITGIAGDQQAALFGQACVTPGLAKATYGTGAFVLVNSGSEEPPVSEQLLSTVGWRIGPTDTYALEGSVFTAGASVQWLRDEMQFIPTSPDVEALARSVPDSGGVVLVPAFAGLGAPYWDAEARGALLGMTRGTSRAHVARATLEAVAFRVKQVIVAMAGEGVDVTELRVDGGMAANDLLMQLQADVLGVPVVRPANVETTSLGAAYLAALGAGLYDSVEQIAGAWRAERTFEPHADADWEHAFGRFQAAT